MNVSSIKKFNTIKQFKMIFICLWVILLSIVLSRCGLPSPTDISLNSLEKPTLAIYNDDQNIYATITGYYPSGNYPNFEGFNLYIGNNNESGEILKRVLYIDKDYELPSKSANPGVGTSDTSVQTIFNGKFNYRFTSSATAEDLALAGVSDITLLRSKSYQSFEKFYFIAKPIQSGVEGSSSDTYSYTIVDYQTNISLTWNSYLSRFGDFSDLLFTNDNSPSQNKIILTGNNNSINVGEVASSIYSRTTTPTTGYVSHALVFASHLFYVKSDAQQLKLYIESISSSGLVISVGYQKEITTDF